MVTGRDTRRGADAQAQLGQRALFIAADATDSDAVESSVQTALAHLGSIDILVNNAGIALAERLVDTPVDEFDLIMGANVRGPFLYARACFGALIESRGSMIHIGSDAGLRAEQPIGAYSVSKAAVVMMSRVLALDGAAHGVRSNCVCPGATAPGMRHIGPASDPTEATIRRNGRPPPSGAWGQSRTSPAQWSTSPATSRVSSPERRS